MRLSSNGLTSYMYQKINIAVRLLTEITRSENTAYINTEFVGINNKQNEYVL